MLYYAILYDYYNILYYTILCYTMLYYNIISGAPWRARAEVEARVP